MRVGRYGQAWRCEIAVRDLTRRQLVVAAGLAALATAIAPRLAAADAPAVEAELKRLFADRPIAGGRVRLDVPPYSENGSAVPLVIDVDSPMTEEDHVKAVHVFAEGNPQPHVVSYRFTPASGRAAASTRMRLARTQNVIAVAEMSDGRLYMAKSEVKVTIGGCAG